MAARRLDPHLGCMRNGNHRRDTATNPELAVHRELTWCNCFNDVVGNLIGDCFVKRTLVAVAPQVQLQRLQLYAKFVWRVVDDDRCEIRLSGYRTKTGEFRAVERNQEIAADARVREGIERSIRSGSHLCAV